MSKRILLVEEELSAKSTRSFLCKAGLNVEHTSAGGDALARMADESWDMVLADLNMPDMSAIDFCHKLRTQGDTTPFVVLSNSRYERDQVACLEIGADDYILKPFAFEALAARLKAILRRSWAGPNLANSKSDKPLALNSIEIDVDNRVVRVANKQVELTNTEFNILRYFVEHPGKVYTRDQLLDNVWGVMHNAYEHTVSAHINRLRAKIDLDKSKPSFIRTVWGVGYRFED